MKSFKPKKNGRMRAETKRALLYKVSGYVPNRIVKESSDVIYYPPTNVKLVEKLLAIIKKEKGL